MRKNDHRLPYGLIYKPQYVSKQERAEILKYLSTIYPIWEQRFSKNNPPPEGQEQRWLLRPVYWLGNWQFACLNYYHPPKGIFNRCVDAEPFPPAMQKLVMRVEDLIRNEFRESDVPRGWHFNTCLINYYGAKQEGDSLVDTARVGEHKDFEPGPVASISFGDRALFQFVESTHKGGQSRVVIQQWLEDSALQVFAGDRFKKKLFHRVQRVEKKWNESFKLNTENFVTRRINFTFRFVPPEHIVPYSKLPAPQREDVEVYVKELAQRSGFFADAQLS